eukprot:6254095-Pyramimonas_sp.AAC.1
MRGKSWPSEFWKTNGSGIDHPGRSRLRSVAPRGPRMWYHFLGGSLSTSRAWARRPGSEKLTAPG